MGSYGSDERGIEIRAVAGGYRVYTKPQHHDVVRRFIKSLRPPLRLTMPALETLAVIGYKQPVTLPEIQEIRGVNCSGVVQTLLEKHLITTAGRKAVDGASDFVPDVERLLMRFGLSDLDELPSLKEFEALAREALGADSGVAETEIIGDLVTESVPGEAEPAVQAAQGEMPPENPSSETSSEISPSAPTGETARHAARGGAG